MFDKGTPAKLFCLLAFCVCAPAFAQSDEPLRVVKSTTNAESENPEICLDFNRSISSIPTWRLAAALRLEADGKTVKPPNIVASNASLCLFPLEHGTAYRLSLKGLRATDTEKR